MRVLVTGHAGFIGSHTVDLLEKENYTVSGMDDFSSSVFHKDDYGAEMQGSIDNWIHVDRKFKQFMPEIVIHLAAQPSLLESVKNPTKDAVINILGTMNILEASRRYGVRKIVFASTSAVYDDRLFIEAPIPEGFQKYPSRPYGVSKATAERYIEISGLDYCILRYGNVYGPRQKPLGENQLIPRAIFHLLKGDEFAIYGDGEQIRDFVYVEDVARANLLAMTCEHNVILNIGTREGASVNDVCGYLWELNKKHFALTDSKNGHPFAHSEAKPNEPRCVRLANHNALKMLDWSPTTSLKDGLKQTYGYWAVKGYSE